MPDQNESLLNYVALKTKFHELSELTTPDDSLFFFFFDARQPISRHVSDVHRHSQVIIDSDVINHVNEDEGQALWSGPSE